MSLIAVTLGSTLSATGRDANAAFPGRVGQIARYTSSDYEGTRFTGGIELVDPASGASEPLIPGGFDPSWAPGGQKLAYLEFGDNDTVNLFVSDGEGSGPVMVAKRVSPEPVGWSADGASVVFSRYKEKDRDVWGLYRASSMGGYETRLTTSHDESPMWSPNGTRIAFLRWFENPTALSLMLAKPDGTEVEELVKFQKDTEAYMDWSPDGASIAFTDGPVVYENGQVKKTPDLYLVDVGTKKVTRVLESAGFIRLISFSGDGSEIAFDDFRNLLAVKPDGSGLRTIKTFEDYLRDQFGSSDSLDWRSVLDESSITLTAKSDLVRRKDIVKGVVRPAHPGLRVTVSLYKKRFVVATDGMEIYLAARKHPTIRSDGKYGATFARASHGKGWCRFEVTFPGDADHAPASRAASIRC